MWTKSIAFKEILILDNNTVVYTLTSPTGVKGTVVDGYGTSPGNTSFEMAKKMQNYPAAQVGN